MPPLEVYAYTDSRYYLYLNAKTQKSNNSPTKAPNEIKIRNINDASEDNDGILIFGGQRNIDLRRQRNGPTLQSQLHVAKIGDICRWETTIAPAYLRNAKDYYAELKILTNKWLRIKNIIQEQTNHENINKNKTREINGYKSIIIR